MCAHKYGEREISLTKAYTAPCNSCIRNREAAWNLLATGASVIVAAGAFVIVKLWNLLATGSSVIVATGAFVIVIKRGNPFHLRKRTVRGLFHRFRSG